MGQFQNVAEFQTAKTRVGWSHLGRLPAGGWPGSWALENGYIFGEIETRGEGGSAGEAKGQECIEQWRVWIEDILVCGE